MNQQHKRPRRQKKGDRLLDRAASLNEIQCDKAVAVMDRLAIQMDRRWGVDRLPELVSIETAQKYGSALAKLNAALEGNDQQEGGAIFVAGADVNPALLDVRFAGGGRVSATRGFFSILTSSNPGLMAPFVATGDFNGDGLTDAAFAAPGESPAPSRANAGVVYAVFGQNGGLPDQIMLDTLVIDDTIGFVVTGAQAGDGIGSALSTGDFNADGGDELAVGGNAGTDFPAGSFDGAVFWINGTLNDFLFTDGFED